MDTDLQSFIARLESAGELIRVPDLVNPVLEVTRRADEQNKSPAARLPSESARRVDPQFHDRGGAAMLFERVKGSDFPLLINAFGSYRRMEMALGCEGGGFEAIARRIDTLVKPEPPRSLAEAAEKARQFAPLLRIGPKRVRGRGACQDVVKTGQDVDLTRLPMIRCWPLDGDFEALGYPGGLNDAVAGLGHESIDAARWRADFAGRYITLAGVHSVHADDRDEAKPRSHNIGMYRMQLMGRQRLAMHWHMHHDGAAHWRSWKKLGRPMPVAIALGGPSVLPYAATCPLPPGLSELLMAGFLQGCGVRLCRGITVPISVPADAEIVIEGFVRTDAGFPGWEPRHADAGALGPGAVFEGPFGDHTGFYSMPDRYPLMEVTAITHRRGAVYPTTVVGLPPQEDYYLGKATERIMLPLLKTLTPDIVDYDLPMFGAFHNCACVQIEKAFPMHARRVTNAVWGAGQMAWTKIVVVVDRHVDVHDTLAVLSAAGQFVEPERDLLIQQGPVDILDHAAPWLGVGGKLGIDATHKWPDEAVTAAPRPRPRRWDSTVFARWEAATANAAGVTRSAAPSAAAGWVFIASDRRGCDAVAAVARSVLQGLDSVEGADRPTFVVMLDAAVDVSQTDVALFHMCANADFARDLSIVGGASERRTAVIDATPKSSDGRYPLPVRAWPPIIAMS
jgi:4-hydroxy-3-polyprenylbenzoate decarboxylase